MEKKGVKHRSFLKISLIVIISIFIVISIGAKVYLYINLLLGNDTLTKISVDKKHLTMSHGQEEKITFTATLSSNPFCEIDCEYNFDDLSRGETKDRGNFSILVIKPFVKEYVIKEDRMGTGQELYRFEIKCRSKQTILCHTKGEDSMGNILITVDYNLSKADEESINSIKYGLESISEELYNFERNFQEINQTLPFVRQKIILGINNETGMFKEDAELLRNNLEDLEKSWRRQDFDLSNKINMTKKDIEKMRNLFNDLYVKIIIPKEKYNSFVTGINEIRQLIMNAEMIYYYNESQAEQLSGIINSFNSDTLKFSGISAIEEKENLYNNISSLTEEINVLKENLLYENDSEHKKYSEYNFIQLNEFDLNSIISGNITVGKIIFEEPMPRCDMFGKYMECCDERCRNENYPIIFVHGHAFNKETSANAITEGFNSIQEELEKEGYLDAGVISLYENSSNELSKIPSPITIKVSYYYDVLKQGDNYVTIIQTRSEDIDTYALRLKELIDSIKENTNKKKVILISHSMGGLVSRRYVQLFGEESVDKMILIGTPNKGIKGKIAEYCPIVGWELECKDMLSDSKFIEKLNSYKSGLEIWNIVGDGCKMEEKSGDGVVLKESAVLKGSKNIIIMGDCSEIDNPLHLKLLNPEYYPKTLETIKTALNSTKN